MAPAGHGHEHQGASLAACSRRSLNRNTTTESILASPTPRSEPASRRPPVPADPALTMFPSDGRDKRRRRHPSHLVWSNAMESTVSEKVGPTQRTLTNVNHKVTQMTKLIHDFPQTRCVLRCRVKFSCSRPGDICVYSVLCTDLYFQGRQANRRYT
jgi:hypothetical protein